MPIFSVKSLSAAVTLPDAAADCRSARRAEQFRYSGQAVYFPAFPGTKYVPFAALTRAWTKNTAVTVKGCCGKELPMIRLRLFYDGEFYQDFLFEHLETANAVLDAVAAARPDIPIQRETAERRAV